jgi:ubiquinone/menaquinone biosynthesis C-methylase UbiE
MPEERGEGSPDGVQDILSRCASGELPPNVALMHIHMRSHDRAAAAAAIERASEQAKTETGHRAARLERMAELDGAHPEARRLVHMTLGAVRHDAPLSPQAVAASFDSAARISPEAASALYSLGDSNLLAAATEEVMKWLRDRRAIAPGQFVLDLGCGSGRIAAGLAGQSCRVIAIDVSHEMLAIARSRCGASNVAFIRTSGEDLAAVATASLDAVVAVDSFPYLVQSGSCRAARHVEECARLLKAEGSLAILNFSYRDPVSADCEDIASLAARTNLRVEENGARPFVFWDGRAFLLRKH